LYNYCSFDFCKIQLAEPAFSRTLNQRLCAVPSTAKPRVCLEERKVLYARYPFKFWLVKKLATRHKTRHPYRAALRAWGRGGVRLKSSGGALQACCLHLPQEIQSSRDMLPAWGREGVEAWRSGGVLQACRRGGICLKSPGTLEAHCRRRDVEVFASRDRELGRCAVGVQPSRY